MTHPTDDELEAMAIRIGFAECAAMLRACKGGAGVSAHGEQIRIWTQEILESLALTDCLDVKSYDSKVDAYVAVSDELRRILSAPEPAPDARQEGWRAAIEAVLQDIRDWDDCKCAPSLDLIRNSIRALAEKGPEHD